MITGFRNSLKTTLITALYGRVITEVGTSDNQFMVIYLVLLNNFMALVYYICDITINEFLLSTVVMLLL